MSHASRRAFFRSSLGLAAWPAALLAGSQESRSQQGETENTSSLTPAEMEAYRRARAQLESSAHMLRAFPLKIEVEPDFIFRATR